MTRPLANRSFRFFRRSRTFPDFALLSPLWGGFPVGTVKMPDSSGLTTSSLLATRPSDTTTLFDKPNTPLQATFEHSDMPRPHNSLPSGILRLFILLLQCRSHGDSYFITSIESESTISRHYPFNRRFSVILQPRHNGDYL